MKFANKHNVRLVVKNTGHDFLGRNLGYGSLSIWTHHLRGAEHTDNGRGTGQSAVSVGAGMQWRDVYEAAARAKRLVVGGADNSVGVAGWILGGGHSALSNQFGLGCDQVLEFETVLPSGEIVIANWRGRTERIPLDGESVQQQALAVFDLPLRAHYHDPDLLIDVWGEPVSVHAEARR